MSGGGPQFDPAWLRSEDWPIHVRTFIMAVTSAWGLVSNRQTPNSKPSGHCWRTDFIISMMTSPTKIGSDKPIPSREIGLTLRKSRAFNMQVITN